MIRIFMYNIEILNKTLVWRNDNGSIKILKIKFNNYECSTVLYID